jgi:hypothetical protein
MALKMGLVNSDVGYSFPEAYVRVIFSRVFKEETLIFCNFYADEQARLDNKQPVKQKEYSATTTDLTGDILPACYNWLKTQTDFNGAVDA